jgi:cation-dependent mannose-6-phosphate receptor
MLGIIVFIVITYVMLTKTHFRYLNRFLSSVMIFFMLFILAGTLYNRFVLRKRGFDQLAQLSEDHLLEVMEFCTDLFWSTLDNTRSSSHTWAGSRSRDLNSTSHHWLSRDEERAMMAADPLEDDTAHDQELQDTNAWRNDAADRHGAAPSLWNYVRPWLDMCTLLLYL